MPGLVHVSLVQLVYREGINYVISNGRRGEWRPIGIEMALQKEFGTYLQFRQAMPDSAASIIETNRVQGNVALTTEFIKNKKRYSFGLKFAGGISSFDYRGSNAGKQYLPLYFSPAVHFTLRRFTYSAQFNLVQSYSVEALLGVHYYL